MNTARKPAGLDVGSTKPLSRAERRAAAARVKADDPSPKDAVVADPPRHANDVAPATPSQSQPEEARGDSREQEVDEHVAAGRVSVHDDGQAFLGHLDHLDAQAQADDTTEPPKVQLKARQRKPKSPFATQLHAGTLARLEWIKARGYAITDTVDDAINTYLDNAGVPRPNINDRMPTS